MKICALRGSLSLACTLPQSGLPLREVTRWTDQGMALVGKQLPLSPDCHPLPCASRLLTSPAPNWVILPFSWFAYYAFLYRIPGPYKIINLKISWLYLVKHLINSPQMPWQGQTKWFCRPYTCGLDVPHPWQNIRDSRAETWCVHYWDFEHLEPSLA